MTTPFSTLSSAGYVLAELVGREDINNKIHKLLSEK
jgi:hypothetical protein